MLEIDRLSAFYGSIPAVREVSMTWPSDKITGIVGLNGAGKSTLLKSVVGLVTTGRGGGVSLDGHDLLGLSAAKIARRGVSLVPEGRHVFGGMSVRENLKLGSALDADTPFEAGLESCLEIFPKLRDLLDRTAAGLSGGEQQMVAISRGMISNPKVLMIDELSLGLAPELALELTARLPGMGTGRALVVVDQDMEALLDVCDHLYVLRQGEVVVDGDVAALKQRTDLEREFYGF